MQPEMTSNVQYVESMNSMKWDIAMNVGVEKHPSTAPNSPKTTPLAISCFKM